MNVCHIGKIPYIEKGRFKINERFSLKIPLVDYVFI